MVPYECFPPSPPSGCTIATTPRGESRPIDRYQYLLLMLGCLVITLPLELVIGARVWRRPGRLARAVLPIAAAFVVWDLIAIERGHWWFSERYTTGWLLAGGIPVEEVVFFLTIPVCGLLTYEAVSILWPRRVPAGAGRAGARDG